MTETGTGYDLSAFNLPPGPAKAQAAPQRGNSSAPDSSPGGYDLSVFDLPEKIEIPQRTLDGRQATEKIYIRDFGKHVRKQVEDAIDRGKPGAAAAALHWQIGVAQGASLMPAQTMKQFEELGQGFAASKNPQAYFQKNLIPFLNTLTPKRRK
ncbi:MAG: hypothetical protein ABSE55_11500 [Terracidiphilus sp.]|jgi:hypothetical protein